MALRLIGVRRQTTRQAIQEFIAGKKHFSKDTCNEGEVEETPKKESKKCKKDAKKSIKDFKYEAGNSSRDKTLFELLKQDMRPLFSVKKIQKHREIYPLLGITCVAFIGFFIYFVYRATISVDDVRWFKGTKTWSEKLDLLNPKKRKLLIFNQEYKPMTEVHEAYEAIAEGEKEAAEKEAAEKEAMEQENAANEALEKEAAEKQAAEKASGK